MQTQQTEQVIDEYQEAVRNGTHGDLRIRRKGHVTDAHNKSCVPCSRYYQSKYPCTGITV